MYLQRAATTSEFVVDSVHRVARCGADLVREFEIQEIRESIRANQLKKPTERYGEQRFYYVCGLAASFVFRHRFFRLPAAKLEIKADSAKPDTRYICRCELNADLQIDKQ